MAKCEHSFLNADARSFNLKRKIKFKMWKRKLKKKEKNIWKLERRIKLINRETKWKLKNYLILSFLL